MEQTRQDQARRDGRDGTSEEAWEAKFTGELLFAEPGVGVSLGPAGVPVYCGLDRRLSRQPDSQTARQSATVSILARAAPGELVCRYRAARQKHTPTHPHADAQGARDTAEGACRWTRSRGCDANPRKPCSCPTSVPSCELSMHEIARAADARGTGGEEHVSPDDACFCRRSQCLGDIIQSGAGEPEIRLLWLVPCLCLPVPFLACLCQHTRSSVVVVVGHHLLFQVCVSSFLSALCFSPFVFVLRRPISRGRLISVVLVTNITYRSYLRYRHRFISFFLPRLSIRHSIVFEPQQTWIYTHRG